MGTSMLEMLRKLIRQDTTKIGGPVGNIYGVVDPFAGFLTSETEQSWLLLELPGTVVPELNQFYQVFVASGLRMHILPCSGGVASRTGRAGVIQLFRGVVESTQVINSTVNVDVGGAGQFAVYINGTLVRRGQSTLTVTLNFQPGRNVLTVLAVAPSVTLTVPPTLPLVGAADVPETPVWESLTTGYLDAGAGTAANFLAWYADPKVGGYRIMRRSPVSLGTTENDDGVVLSVGEVTDDTFTVIIGGDHTNSIVTGTELLAGPMSVGTVVSFLLNEAGNTTVRCRLTSGRVATEQAWVGQQAALGAFAEITRITRTNNIPIMRYTDAAVTAFEPYEYALQAFGLVDAEMISPLSDIRYIVAGDLDAPGQIVFEDEYPKATNRMITVRFTTPSDRDYNGVHVYRRQLIANDLPGGGTTPYLVAGYANKVVTLDLQELEPNTLGPPDVHTPGYMVRFGTDPIAFPVLSNTAGTITLLEGPPSAPANGTALTIFRDERVKTDMGLPNRIDEFTFEAKGYGWYYFATFDRSRNEQPEFDALHWEYTPEADSFILGPIIALRQLVPAEQAFFTEYASTTQFAIVELFAYSPSQPSVPITAKFTGVKLFYQRRGDEAPIELSPVPQQNQDFPFLVTNAPAAVVDNPAGTRSRFILLDRSQDNSWIRVWAIDENELESDTLTFVADLDTTPEISSLETFIDSSANTASFIAVGDDDTLGAKWYVDPASAGEPSATSPVLVDLRAVKSFTNSPVPIPLPLGSRKTLVLTPYGGFSTRTVALQSAGRSSNITTFVFQANHNLTVGQRFTMSGVTPTSFNGSFIVKTVVSPTSITVDDVGANVGVAPRAGTMTVGSVTGTEGETIRRELIRTPRSFVTTNSKDTNGNQTPDWVEALFSMAPAATVMASGTGSGAGTTWTDGTKAWTANQWNSSSSPTSFYYLRVLPANADPVARLIIGNTGTQLTLASALPGGPYAGSQPYEIVDGAVMVQKLATSAMPSTLAGFTPTGGRETYNNPAEDTFYLAFYATKNGCVPESIRIVQVDPDPMPSIGNLAGQYEPTFEQLTWTASVFDDDCKSWRCYVKKGAWPTKAGTFTAGVTQAKDLDETYLRFTGQTAQNSFNHNARDGVWYAIAVPVNSFNSDGQLVGATCTISGGTGPGGISNLTATPQVGTQNILVQWDHSSTLTSSNTIDIDAYRMNVTPLVADPFVRDRPVTWESGGTNTVPNKGSVLYNAGVTFAASGTAVQYEFWATLDGGNTENVTVNAFIGTGTGGGGGGGGAVTLSGVSASTLYEGGCYGINLCGQLYTNRVLWSTNATDSNYRVDLYVARDPVGAEFQLGVSNINPAAGMFDDWYECTYMSPNGFFNFWTYRVDIVARATNVTVASATTSTVMQKIKVCKDYNNDAGGSV